MARYCVELKIAEQVFGPSRRPGESTVLQGGQGGARPVPREVRGTVAVGGEAPNPPLERATFSKNGHHFVLCQKQFFNYFMNSKVPNMSLARVGLWVVCDRDGMEAPLFGPREVRGTVAGNQGMLRVPLERAKLSKNGDHLELCQKKVFNDFMTLRVPNKFPA